MEDRDAFSVDTGHKCSIVEDVACIEMDKDTVGDVTVSEDKECTDSIAGNAGVVSENATFNDTVAGHTACNGVVSENAPCNGTVAENIACESTEHAVTACNDTLSNGSVCKDNVSENISCNGTENENRDTVSVMTACNGTACKDNVLQGSSVSEGVECNGAEPEEPITVDEAAGTANKGSSSECVTNESTEDVASKVTDSEDAGCDGKVDEDHACKDSATEDSECKETDMVEKMHKVTAVSKDTFHKDTVSGDITDKNAVSENKSDIGTNRENDERCVRYCKNSDQAIGNKLSQPENGVQKEPVSEVLKNKEESGSEIKNTVNEADEKETGEGKDIFSRICDHEMTVCVEHLKQNGSAKDLNGKDAADKESNAESEHDKEKEIAGDGMEEGLL